MPGVDAGMLGMIDGISDENVPPIKLSPDAVPPPEAPPRIGVPIDIKVLLPLAPELLATPALPADDVKYIDFCCKGLSTTSTTGPAAPAELPPEDEAPAAPIKEF